MGLSYPISMPSLRASFNVLGKQHAPGTRIIAIPKVSVDGDSQVVQAATLGGVVVVGTQYFGLTVAHIFNPDASHVDIVQASCEPVWDKESDEESALLDYEGTNDYIEVAKTGSTLHAPGEIDMNRS